MQQLHISIHSTSYSLFTDKKLLICYFFGFQRHLIIITRLSLRLLKRSSALSISSALGFPTLSANQILFQSWSRAFYSQPYRPASPFGGFPSTELIHWLVIFSLFLLLVVLAPHLW